MVKVKEKFLHHPDGTLDIEAWLQKIQQSTSSADIPLLKKAYQLAHATSQGLTTFYGQPCIEQGLEMAEIMLQLKLDNTAIAAALIISTAQLTELSLETIQKQLGKEVATLVESVLKMNVINTLPTTTETKNPLQIDRLRKLVLAMVSDIRAVIIKLAEQTTLIRGIKNINKEKRKQLAQETMDIYAPLANRLGIGQLKWELEDLSFHYLDPETYKTIAGFLAEKRMDREERIQYLIQELKKSLHEARVEATVTGRAKHIYSIFLKKERKNIDYKNIFDYSAARILVSTVEECYMALSLVHKLWEPIPEEFDDYIAHPKPNGYRSIHTAVIGPQGKITEIQIRTYGMHEQSEQGVAAHWIYKENKPQTAYEEKITYLRQLLAWEQDITQKNSEKPQKTSAEIFSDRLYVFTPAGDVMDLPVGATPLDFAYHIHSELGHHCRGAKINNQMVSLNHPLQTGDQIEILTTPQGGPSRDWLNRELGYLKTSRARAKVAQWFKQKETERYHETGKQLLERELTRLGIQSAHLNKIATPLGFKNEEALLTALGHGNIRLNQIIQAIRSEEPTAPPATLLSTSLTSKKSAAPFKGIEIAGIDDLLVRMAKCCKPIPGDTIIGYITQGRGVSIHRKDCYNVTQLLSNQQHRLVTVNWDKAHLGLYSVDIFIEAHGRENALKNITQLFTHLNLTVIALRSTINQKSNMISIISTIQISESSQLNQLINKIYQLPFVVEVKRMSD